METNMKNYNVIKGYKKDKVKLYSLNFAKSMWAYHNFQSYLFKNWDKMEKNVDKVKQVLDQCFSIDKLHLRPKGPYNYELFNVLMNTKAKIGTLHLHREDYFTVEERIKISLKFSVVFILTGADHALLSNEFLTEILPRSTIRISSRYVTGTIAPMNITDFTLKALVSGSKLHGEFSIEPFHSSITIKGIVDVIKNHHERVVDNNLTWNLGYLQPNQAADAERYFWENGEMRRFCKVEMQPGNDLICYKVSMFDDGFEVYKYRIFFNVINH